MREREKEKEKEGVEGGGGGGDGASKKKKKQERGKKIHKQQSRENRGLFRRERCSEVAGSIVRTPPLPLCALNQHSCPQEATAKPICHG